MGLAEKKCVPCQGGTPPLTNEDEDRYLEEIPSWKLERDGIHKIGRTFKFGSFLEGIDFVNRIALIADNQGHHPDIQISFKKVDVELHTHAIIGLSEADFIMAAKIDGILE